MDSESPQCGHATALCAICQKPCLLEDCVVDELGRAVHKKCYCDNVALSAPRRSKYDEVEELLQQARELREVADQLLKKSDRLVAAYEQLTGKRGTSGNPS